MKYCSTCGAEVSYRVPPGDHLPRHICNSCGEIHYLNPKIVVGALPVWGERVLLCRRAIEPRHGLWTLPAGFMENGESAAQGAIRETAEEARARIALDGMYTLVSLPYISQIHILFRARLLDTGFEPGEESLETRLFQEHEIPWNEIAFRSIALTLRHFFADRRRGVFEFRSEELGAATS